ncbi:MAG TPA: hypothetical protein VIB55_09810 [Longimicrobium sp.]
MKVAFDTLCRGAVLLAVVILGGCEGPVGTDAVVYTLATVNGKPLPAPHRHYELVEAVSAELTLRPDGTASMVSVDRCPPDPPPGLGCAVYDGGRQTNEGSYSRSEGWVQFGFKRFQASFHTRKVVLTESCRNPVHCTTTYETVYEFRR